MALLRLWRSAACWPLLPACREPASDEDNELPDTLCQKSGHRVTRYPKVNVRFPVFDVAAGPMELASGPGAAQRGMAGTVDSAGAAPA